MTTNIQNITLPLLPFYFKFIWVIHFIPYQPLLLRPLINAGSFYAGPNSATSKISLNVT